MTPEQAKKLGEEAMLAARMECLPQCDALIMAGWKFELPPTPDSEPWQWFWRRPPKRKGSKGKRFLSTNQAYQAGVPSIEQRANTI